VWALDEKIKKQFRMRSSEFDVSAQWISDKNLIDFHIKLSGNPAGKALDLCCGTGQIGRALKKQGWDVTGLDICDSMVTKASDYFPVIRGDAQQIQSMSNSFHLVVCRQAFQFLDVERTLSEILRILTPNGIFVVSLTVPFSDVDAPWLYKIHRLKQPLLKNFLTADDLVNAIERVHFSIETIKKLRVRESINTWMDYAPELSREVRNNVIAMIKDAPSSYKQLHNVEINDGELFEDWQWVVIKAIKG